MTYILYEVRTPVRDWNSGGRGRRVKYSKVRSWELFRDPGPGRELEDEPTIAVYHDLDFAERTLQAAGLSYRIEADGRPWPEAA